MTQKPRPLAAAFVFFTHRRAGEIHNMAQTDEQVARRWAAVTISKFRSEITRLNIGRTGRLRSSFTAAVAASGGGQLKVRLGYAVYGQYVDMGVGRGHKRGSGDTKAAAKLLGATGRKAKKWYSPTIARETFILSQIMATRAGTKTLSVLDTITRATLIEM